VKINGSSKTTSFLFKGISLGFCPTQCRAISEFGAADIRADLKLHK